MPIWPPIPEPFEAYAAQLDDLFSRARQRGAFREYLAGWLLPAERNETLTALANIEPVVGTRFRRRSGRGGFSVSCLGGCHGH